MRKIDIKKLEPLLLENLKNLSAIYITDINSISKRMQHCCLRLFKTIEVINEPIKGLHKVIEKSDYYDIIICDFEIGHKIKRMLPNKKVIVVDEEEKFKLEYITVDAFVKKPVGKTEMYNVLYEVTSAVMDELQFKEYVRSLEEDDTYILIQEEICNIVSSPYTSVSEMKESLKAIIMPYECEEMICEEPFETYTSDEERMKNVRFTLGENEKVDATTFVSELAELDFERVDLLKEHFEEMSIELNHMQNADMEIIKEKMPYLKGRFEELYIIIHGFFHFSILSESFKHFSDFLGTLSEESLQDESKREMLIETILGFTDDLIDWLDIIFFQKASNNIHYLDASFANTCIEIEALFNEQEIASDEDDLEFF